MKSKIQGVTRKFSNLDLVIQGRPSRRQLSQLKDYFEESRLPFKVDISVWDDLDPSFQELIKKDLIRI